MDDSHQPTVVPNLAQSRTKKWVDIMDGAPSVGGRTMLVDVTVLPQGLLMPRLPKETRGWAIPYQIPKIKRTVEAGQASQANVVGGRLFGWFQRAVVSFGELLGSKVSGFIEPSSTTRARRCWRRTDRWSRARECLV